MSKIAPAVRKEVKHIAVGVGAMCAVMLAVFAVLGKLDYRAILGALLGGGFAVLNFFWLGLSVQAAADEEQDVAKKKMHLSYTLRMMVMLAVAVVGIALPHFNWVTVILPLLFPRITIAIMQIFKMTGRADGEDANQAAQLEDEKIHKGE